MHSPYSLMNILNLRISTAGFQLIWAKFVCNLMIDIFITSEDVLNTINYSCKKTNCNELFLNLFLGCTPSSVKRRGDFYFQWQSKSKWQYQWSGVRRLFLYCVFTDAISPQKQKAG